MMPSITSMTSARSSAGMRGASSISTVTSTTRWCRTWLCLTNCVSASGTPFGADARNTAVPGSRAWHLVMAVSIRSSSGWRSFAARAFDQPDAAAPGQHQERDDGGEQQRKPAALDQLGRVRREENAVDDEEEAVDRDHEDRRIAPLDRDQRRQQRGDRHQQRHRDAVGAGQRIRGAEADHGAERRGRQQPVHQRHIDLADGARWWCA